jgi:hypothetical protein
MRLLIAVAAVVSAAGLLAGAPEPGWAEPAGVQCWGCFVKRVLVSECTSAGGANCNMYGCYGGNGLCRSGCSFPMVPQGTECANVGCGWTQWTCINMDCWCEDVK